MAGNDVGDLGRDQAMKGPVGPVRNLGFIQSEVVAIREFKARLYCEGFPWLLCR